PFLMSLAFHIIFFFSPPPSLSSLYSLSLHDALPISAPAISPRCTHSSLPTATRPTKPSATVGNVLDLGKCPSHAAITIAQRFRRDRKSTRLNSSHVSISYAVFCLKKKIIYDYNDK